MVATVRALTWSFKPEEWERRWPRERCERCQGNGWYWLDPDMSACGWDPSASHSSSTAGTLPAPLFGWSLPSAEVVSGRTLLVVPDSLGCGPVGWLSRNSLRLWITGVPWRNWGH